MIEHPRPRVAFSRCLGFDPCRYDGSTIADRVVEQLKPFVEPIAVCPEVEIGLGVPRPPIRRIEEAGRLRLFQPETGRDVTEEMASFSERFLSSLEGIDGFLLKDHSPSCGPSQVKIYDGTRPTARHRDGAGAFAAGVAERFSGLAVEGEGSLQNGDVRRHYLTKLFALARFRTASTTGALAAFHAQSELLLTAYDPRGMRELSRLVANVDRCPTEVVIDRYRERLLRALAWPPQRTEGIDVLQHALGVVSDRLTRRERDAFLDAVDRCRRSRIPLSGPTRLMRSWILHFDVEPLADQVYFEPYPEALADTLDEEEGRGL